MNRKDIEKIKSGMLRGAYFIGATHWFPIERITKTIRIEPNYVWQQKNPLLMEVPNFPKIDWGYKLPTRIYDSIETPACEILEIFWPLRHTIVPFVQDNHLRCSLDIELNICEEDDFDLPVVCELSVETMKKICDLNTTFQITHHFHYQ